MFEVDFPGETAYQVRCGVCRRQSWFGGVSSQGKAPLLGLLHVYQEDLIAGLSDGRLSLDGWLHTDDGFYASYESYIRANGYSHQRAVSAAIRDGAPRPKRTKPVHFLNHPSRPVRFAGRPIGGELRDQCRNDHRINIGRGTLRSLVKSAGYDLTIFVE